jgi:uncharacterized protein
MSSPASDYSAALDEWRAERERKLLADQGWLSINGLYWLKPGVNRVGADPQAEVALPQGSAAHNVGVFELRDSRISFRAEPGIEVTSGGARIREIEMTPDDSGEPTRIQLAALTMHVIHRGSRYAIRLADGNSPMRRGFKGLKHYPALEKYRIAARFTPYEPPRTIPVLNVLGETDLETSPGFVTFNLDGRELRLEPVWSGKRLFFIFKDQTAGHGSYPAGRFLYADPPLGGTVLLDFNKAENPPCAFTPYATCPLPPPQNRLPVAVPAGELDYHP